MKRGQTTSLILAIFILLSISAVPNVHAASISTVSDPNLDTNYKGWVDGSTFQYQVHPQASSTIYAEGIMANTVFELQNAYDLNPLYSAGYTGSGQTVVIVVAYGSPTINNDLLTFIQWQNSNGANLPWTTLKEVKNHLKRILPHG